MKHGALFQLGLESGRALEEASGFAPAQSPSKSSLNRAYARSCSTILRARAPASGWGGRVGSYLMSQAASVGFVFTPGFIRPYGSKVPFTSWKAFRLDSLHTRGSAGVRTRPSPCSPERVPPR